MEPSTPALYEPHFDQFGSGADLVRPAGEQFDVAVVAAASESGDSVIFPPALVDERGDAELVDQLRRPALH